MWRLSHLRKCPNDLSEEHQAEIHQEIMTERHTHAVKQLHLKTHTHTPADEEYVCGSLGYICHTNALPHALGLCVSLCHLWGPAGTKSAWAVRVNGGSSPHTHTHTSVHLTDLRTVAGSSEVFWSFLLNIELLMNSIESDNGGVSHVCVAVCLCVYVIVKVCVCVLGGVITSEPLEENFIKTSHACCFAFGYSPWYHVPDVFC